MLSTRNWSHGSGLSSGLAAILYPLDSLKGFIGFLRAADRYVECISLSRDFAIESLALENQRIHVVQRGNFIYPEREAAITATAAEMVLAAESGQSPTDGYTALVAHNAASSRRTDFKREKVEHFPARLKRLWDLSLVSIDGVAELRQKTRRRLMTCEELAALLDEENEQRPRRNQLVDQICQREGFESFKPVLCARSYDWLAGHVNTPLEWFVENKTRLEKAQRLANGTLRSLTTESCANLMYWLVASFPENKTCDFDEEMPLRELVERLKCFVGFNVAVTRGKRYLQSHSNEWPSIEKQAARLVLDSRFQEGYKEFIVPGIAPASPETWETLERARRETESANYLEEHRKAAQEALATQKLGQLGAWFQMEAPRDEIPNEAVAPLYHKLVRRIYREALYVRFLNLVSEWLKTQKFEKDKDMEERCRTLSEPIEVADAPCWLKFMELSGDRFEAQRAQLSDWMLDDSAALELYALQYRLCPYSSVHRGLLAFAEHALASHRPFLYYVLNKHFPQ